MFYLQFPVFIIYLYYLALLSALQTQQKHSQWRYADSAPFVETQAEDYDKKCIWFLSAAQEVPSEEYREII